MNAIINPTQWNGTTPPDYVAIYIKRAKMLAAMRASPTARIGALEYYRTRPAEFICDWLDTVDPRKAGTDTPARVPFILFQRQREFVQFIYELLDKQTGGLAEKCRDFGATWSGVAISVHLWRFWDGAAVGWGSRKQELVDRIGDMDSIFEKIRSAIEGLPREFWPKGFEPKNHMSFMKVFNPETGASITGESGDDIGRGGRKLIYWKDESAWYQRPERIEAALGDNTNVQIDISSVHGTGNVFHRRRMAKDAHIWTPTSGVIHGVTNVFIMDWRDHPAKDDAWYEARRKKAESDGLMHIFEQEVNRNYSASVEGIIIPAIWVRAAFDAHKKIPGMEDGPWVAGFDPYDEGRDKHALVKAKGVVIKYAEDWTEGDTGDATRKVVVECRKHGLIDINYDAPGVGAGVKTEANRLSVVGEMPNGMRFISWNGGAGVRDPEGRVDDDAFADIETGSAPRNKEMFGNIKAQAWWSLRRRFEKTYRVVVKGETYPADELVSIDTDRIPADKLGELERQLSQPTRKEKTGTMKLIVDKSPEGSSSPNLGDGAVMALFPVNSGYIYDLSKSL